MLIIPTINCLDFTCVEEKFQKAAKFGADWVQIDIADKKFTKHKTWDNAEEFKILNFKFKINVEIHLMVENSLTVIGEWIKVGAKRIIVHLEAVKVLEFQSLKVSNNIEIGLAINPKTPVENLIPFLKDFKFIQILAVNPGLSGQKFQPQVLDKIKFLKKNFSDVIIEVDGGINLETTRMCKEAGADILAAGSYIWESKSPEEAYKKLIAI